MIRIFNRNLGRHVPEEYRREIYARSLYCSHDFDAIGTPLRTPAQLPRGARHRARHEPVHARGMQFVRGMGRCERRREAGRRAQLRFLYGRRLHPQQDRDLLPAAGGPSLRQHRLGGDDRRAVGHELRRANRDDQCRERARAARIGDTHLDPRTRDPATCGDHRRGAGDRPPPRHLRQRIAARGLGTRREGGDHRENAPPNRALRGRRGSTSYARTTTSRRRSPTTGTTARISP